MEPNPDTELTAEVAKSCAGAEREHEPVEPAGREYLHDVPEDGPAPDLDHRLGPDCGLFGEPRAEPAAQDYHLGLALGCAARGPLGNRLGHRDQLVAVVGA